MRPAEGDGMLAPIAGESRIAHLEEKCKRVGHDLPRSDPSNLDRFNSLRSELHAGGLTKKVKRPDAVGSA